MMDIQSPKEQHDLAGGKLYALGSNGSGQLGIGHHEDASAPIPATGSLDSAESNIASIACGGNHTIIRFNNGKLAVTGDNNDGRCLTTPSAEAEEHPCRLLPVESEIIFSHVTATWSATTAVTIDGRVLTCGSGNSGELGQGPGTETSHTLTTLTAFPPQGTSVVKLASCMAHVVAVLSNGEVWGWGKARKGQLGKPYEDRWQPSKIEGVPFFVVDAVCGKDFTCVFGRASEGKLLMLGPKSNDRFGVKANAPATVPDWKQVAASWGSVFVLLESGQLTGWGRDDRGQLPPRSLPSLESVAAGSEHCLGLTKDGEVVAWGWGEHGNCGPLTDENSNVRGRWNEIIETPRTASAVFAGCATSFVVTREAAGWQSET